LNGLSKEIAAVGAHSRPSLIIWGDLDESVPFKKCFPVYEKAFQTHARVFKQMKHAVFLEKIEEVNQVILDFLDGKLAEKETLFL
jgi:pimeloyl-ACP methyl ester carboxylesterase